MALGDRLPTLLVSTQPPPPVFAYRPPKAHLWDYFSLTARVLLAFTFIGYG
jgi:hypothetical protein